MSALLPARADVWSRWS